MGYNDGAGAQYPQNIAQIRALMDKVGASVFQSAGVVVNPGDEIWTVPSIAPYCIRLNLVPQETLDNTGNPTGVNIAGLAEMPWDANNAPTSGKFMTNYINGELKFAADMAGKNVQPGYTGTGSWFWAEVINKIVRELLAVQNVLGVNPMASFQSVAARIAATESEVSAARGGAMNLNTRLNGIDAAIAPLSGASFTDKEPSAQTGVLGSAAVTLTTDLYLDPNTVSNDTVKLKNSADVDQPLTAVTYDTASKTITGTHATLLDDVYTAYTLAGLRDTLGRDVAPVSWIFGVGSALANAKPTVSNITVVNPSQTGFTVNGAESDTESDAMARIDVGYSTTNDVGTAVVQQLTGADITSFLGAGKTLAVSLAAGNYYIWARAVETLPGGGQQVGDWVAGGTFTVLSDQPPAGLNAAKLTVSNPTQTGVSWQYNPGTDAAPTDPDDPTAVISFNVQIDSGAITNYTWAQIQTLHSVTGLSKAVGGTYTVGIQVQAVTGAKTEYSSWATVTSAAVPAHTAPSAPTLGTPTVGNASATVAVATGSTFYNGATLSTYNWYYRQTGQSTWISDGSGSSPHTFSTGLTNGTSYDFCAETVDNQGGVSAKSAVVTAAPVASFSDNFSGVASGASIASSNWAISYNGNTNSSNASIKGSTVLVNGTNESAAQLALASTISNSVAEVRAECLAIQVDFTSAARTIKWTMDPNAALASDNLGIVLSSLHTASIGTGKLTDIGAWLRVITDYLSPNTMIYLQGSSGVTAQSYAVANPSDTTFHDYELDIAAGGTTLTLKEDGVVKLQATGVTPPATVMNLYIVMGNKTTTTKTKYITNVAIQ